MSGNVLEAVEQALDESIRPFLDSHAGGVEVAGIDESGAVQLRFVGACTACPALPVTMHAAVVPVLVGLEGVTKVTSSNVHISRFAAERIEKLRNAKPQVSSSEEQF